MAGDTRAPYRLPCGLSAWPTRPQLLLGGCQQHGTASDKNVAKYCNVDIEEATPTWRATCEVEGQTNREGNCYGACVPGSVTGVLTTAGPWPTETTNVQLSAGCGEFKIGDIVHFAGDPNDYTVTNGIDVACPGSMATYFLDITPGLAVAISTETAVTIDPQTTYDATLCHKWGWKAVRARKAWHGMAGFGSGCAGCACGAATTHYLHLTKWVRYQLSGQPDPLPNYYVEVERSIRADKGSGVLTQAADECSNESDMPEFGTGSTAIWLQAGWACGPNFPETDAPFGHPGAWATTGEFLNYLYAEACEAEDGVFEYDDGFTTYRAEVTVSETSVVLRFLLTTSLGPETTEVNTEWTLDTDPDQIYTLEQVMQEVKDMLDLWDLSNDVQYPWRPTRYWRWDNPSTQDEHFHVPLVQAREAGPLPMAIPLDCAAYASCDGHGDGSDPETCPFDGETIGAPLDRGTGPHYAFWDDSGDIAVRGWNPGFYLPQAATWWTVDEELDIGNYPEGGWLMLEGNVVTAQKWARTLERTESVNFFRPCGEDRDDPAYTATAWPICGRVQVASVTIDSGVGTVALAAVAPYLRNGDRFDFVRYATDTFAETVPATGDDLVVLDIGYGTARGMITHAGYIWGDSPPGNRNVHIISGVGTLRIGDVVTFAGSANEYTVETLGNLNPLLDDESDMTVATTDAGDAYFTITPDLTSPDVALVSEKSIAVTVKPKLSFTFTDAHGIGACFAACTGTSEEVAACKALCTGTHIKSHNAPHFKWHDDNPKGDFVWCTKDYNGCEATSETNPLVTCEDDCLRSSPCSPSVATVLFEGYTETFPRAKVKLLPETPANSSDAQHYIRPRDIEQDPFYTDEDPIPYVESRCSAPDGAPDFIEGIGYAVCPEDDFTGWV